VLGTRLGALILLQATTRRIDEHFAVVERGGLGPASVNRLRAILHCVFAAAISSGKWTGQNPVSSTGRRTVPKKAYTTLRASEIKVLLEHVPHLWRGLFATAIWTGMRKGELLGLRKSDVDLDPRFPKILVARSYGHATTKGGHADEIPVAEDLRPYLAAAMNESPSELMFPRQDGTMGRPWEPLEVVLRASLVRAGLVEGYELRCPVCDREAERHADRIERRCATCGGVLMITPVPRPMRFHDLRHTTATLLLRAGVDVHRVQKILRHRDVRTTTTTYAHLGVADLLDAVNKLAA
jgi:integrase